MKMRLIAVLTASLLIVSASQTAFSQQDEASQSDASKAAEDSAAESADGSSQEETSAQGQKASGEESGDTSAKDEDSGSADAQANKDAKPATGPGGRPLRDDYPGTDESKKPHMDTERIEGLTFDEGDQPEDAYDMRIRELETKVDDLKEKVFKSKARVKLLQETVLSDNLAGSRAIISHENELGGTYALKRALYALDGARVFNERDSDGSLSDKEKLEVYNASISPGHHRVSVLLELEGSGYGVFSYMEGYRFKVQASCEFKAQEGRSTFVKVHLIDQGAMKDYKERPGVQCATSSTKLSPDNVRAAEGSKKDADGKEGAADKGDGQTDKEAPN